MRSSLVWMCGCLLVASRLWAQDTQPPAEPQPVAPSGPTFQFRGFADINFSATSDRRSDDGRTIDGFTLGNVVGHVSSSLGGKFSFYAEVIVEARPNGFDLDVARSILRYDYNDRFKVSVGRYHAPVGYWNTAFHRGLWLQTTVFRPDFVREEFLQPDHFMGVFAEGVVSHTAGLGYIVGFGNGREGDLHLACEQEAGAGCLSRHRAGVGRLFVRPPQVANVEFGGAVYRDTIAVDITDNEGVTNVHNFPELITSAYVAISRETPEVIAEVSNVRHHDRRNGNDYNTQAFYVQAAYRVHERVKPYARFEKAISPGAREPVTGNLDNWKALGGLRFELTDTATLKLEYGHRRRPNGDRVDGFFAQTAFTF